MSMDWSTLSRRVAFRRGWKAARNYYGVSEFDTPRGQVEHGAECLKVKDRGYRCTCDPVAESLRGEQEAAQAYPATGALVSDTGPLYLFRVVERPLYAVDDSGLPWGGEWKWAGTGWGRPRTYRTLRAARSVASRLQAQYQRAGVQMEVAVQTAPIGIWRAVE